ncbi:DUF5906 domain-containing protein [Deferribacter thermophilus]|uniref:primase-helicase family protein n=1 Tax=Deferribacter thermophilus TaxID=53573 RepID=UPI003C26C9B8
MADKEKAALPQQEQLAKYENKNSNSMTKSNITHQKTNRNHKVKQYIISICDKYEGGLQNLTNDIFVKKLVDNITTKLKIKQKKYVKDLIDEIKQQYNISNSLQNIYNIVQNNLYEGFKLYYDFTAQQFLKINLESKNKEYFNREATKRLFKSYFSLTDKDTVKILIEEMIPSVKTVFDPHMPAEFIKDGVKYVNLFQKNKYMLLNTKKYDLNVNYIKSNFPHISTLLKNLFVYDDRIEYAINWISYIINTLNKTRNVILTKGIQGTGKGVFHNIVLKPLFNNYTIEASNTELQSSFNSYIENKLLVIFNEVKGNFNENSIIFEKLKQYIADDEIIINEKNIKPYAVKNYANIIMFSNMENPVRIEFSDRRYTIFETASMKLVDVVEQKHNITITEFIEKLKKEREAFYNYIANLKYDEQKAITIYNTEERENIIFNTNNTVKLALNYIKYCKLLELAKVIIKENENVEYKNIEDFLYKLQQEISLYSSVTNETLNMLYNLLIKNEESLSRDKFYKICNTFFESKKKNIKGKSIRVKVVNESTIQLYKNININLLAKEIKNLYFEDDEIDIDKMSEEEKQEFDELMEERESIENEDIYDDEQITFP